MKAMKPMPSNRRPSFLDVQKIDEYLDVWNLRRVSVTADGNCFFHAVEGYLVREAEIDPDARSISHESLRTQTVKYLREHDIIGPNQTEKWWNFTMNEESREEYLDRLSINGEWVDHISVQVYIQVPYAEKVFSLTIGYQDNVKNLYFLFLYYSGDGKCSTSNHHYRDLT